MERRRPEAAAVTAVAVRCSAWLGALSVFLEGTKQEVSGAIIIRLHKTRLDAATTARDNNKWVRPNVGNLRPREVLDVPSAAPNGDALRSDKIASVIPTEPNEPEKRDKNDRKTDGALERVDPRMAANDARKKSANTEDAREEQEQPVP